MSEFTDNTVWAGENELYFIEADEYVLDINRQNKTYEQVQAIGDPEMKEFSNAATSHLKERQQRSFTLASEASQLVPYEELGLREMDLAKRLDQARAEILTIQLAAEAQVALQANRFKELIPEIAQKIDLLAEGVKKRRISEAETSAIAELEKLEVEYSALKDLYDIAGREWQIPALLSPKERKLDVSEEIIQRYTVDQFPAQKGSPTPSQIAEIVKRKFPEEKLYDASEFLALLLAEVPNTSFTLEQLAQIMYGEGEKENSSRVSALISNLELGKTRIIGEVLEGQGLIMQRGKRVTLNAMTLDKIGPGKVIFRATDAKSPLTDPKINAVLDRGLTVEDSSWKNINPEILPEETAQEKPTKAKKIARLANEGIVLRKVEQLNDGIDDEKIDSGIESDLDARAGSIPEARVPKWLPSFEASIRDAIKRFEEDGIMQKPGDVRRDVVRNLTKSGTLGTPESLSRAVNNGIIPKLEGNEASDPSLAYDIGIFLCMAVQNPQASVFQDRHKRPVAMETVQRMVAEHFKAKEQITA